MKRWLLLLLLFGAVRIVRSESYNTWMTTNVSQDDGDTIVTSQATTSCTTGCVGVPQLISAAITNRGNRRRVFCNASPVQVYLGTASVTNTLNSTGFQITASTGAFPCYSTYSTAAFYGQSIAPSSATITVIQEKNSAP